MIQKEDVTVVLPALNEKEAVESVIRELKQEGYKNIIVIDGYSDDGTFELAQQNGVKVTRQHGVGKSMAIKTAIEQVKTPFLIVMDADCTYAAEDIAKFLPHSTSYDEIIGFRTNGRGNIPWLNRLGNWLITKSFNFLFGTNLKDVCSGMYMLRSDFAKQMNLETRGFDVEVEIAAQAAKEARITQIPINYKDRVGNKKLSSWKDGFKILTSVWKLARLHNPVFLFSIISALGMIPAVIILGWISIELFISGTWHAGWSLVGVILLFISIQSFVISTVAILLKRMEQRLAERLKMSRSEST